MPIPFRGHASIWLQVQQLLGQPLIRPWRHGLPRGPKPSPQGKPPLALPWGLLAWGDRSNACPDWVLQGLGDVWPAQASGPKSNPQRFVCD